MWKIRVRDMEGRCRLEIYQNGVLVGFLNISWASYRDLTRDVVSLVLRIARGSIAETLGKLLWSDAQRMSEESSELAKQKLAAFGWNQEKIDEYADRLARQLAEAVTQKLPEHE